MSRPVRFDNGLVSHSQQLPSKYVGQPHHAQPPVGYTYEAFQTPSSGVRVPSIGSTTSKPVSMSSTPVATPRSRDYVTDTDTTMEDADPYNKAKYSSRPSRHSRPPSQFLPHEESSAARRYSPMNILSPSIPYSDTSPGKSQNSYAFPVGNSQWSPSRPSNYASPPQAYHSPPCQYCCLSCDCCDCCTCL